MRGYTCANCGEWFLYDESWTDEEAMAEAIANGFGPDEDMEIVCDDCYRGMGLIQVLLGAGGHDV